MSGTPLCDELLKGIAVVIDDQINDSDSDIAKLIEDIEEKHIPCVKYSELPDISVVESFSDILFIILDWKFDMADGVSGSQYQVEDNIDFIRHVRKNCFVPIFIFTNKILDDLEEDLRSHNAADIVGDSMIFLKNKSELIGGKLFDEIEEWLKSTPSAYVIKKWAMEYKKAKNSMFLDLYSKHSSWPSIFWKRFDTDGTNPSYELREMLMKNLLCRCSGCEFDKEIVCPPGTVEYSGEDYLSVWGGSYFIDEKHLDSKSIMPGDIFFKNGKYLINIKAECDCVLRDNSNPQLYLLEGAVCNGGMLESKKALFKKDKKYHINTQESSFLCIGISDNKQILFNFKSLSIKTWRSLKKYRIGRLTQPFIGSIQQKYATYLHRIGLPPTPDEICKLLIGK